MLGACASDGGFCEPIPGIVEDLHFFGNAVGGDKHLDLDHCGVDALIISFLGKIADRITRRRSRLDRGGRRWDELLIWLRRGARAC
jgi:hypothetical protein